MTRNCLTDDQLKALLQNGSQEALPSSWIGHFEECSTCHQRLERMSGDDWMSAIFTSGSKPAQLSTNLDRVMRELKISGPTATGEQQVPLSLPAHFLEPSERAGMIGRFGPYEIIETIASGGMGIVFKALDPTLNRVVAIKVLPPMLAAHESARERFVREARAAAAVSHLHVVTIHAVDEAKGLPYLVMQFVSGRSLDKRIAQTGPLRVEEILRIGMQMAAGLAAAHAQGLVHRDIKPGNVLLENGIERVKLTDFGLARAVDEPGLTQTGYIAGTPEYMSPEQANGQRVDHRSDLFCLGSVLYAMSTGKSPFHAESTLRVMRKVCDEAPPPVHEVNPAIPRELSDVIAQLMEKEPARRFQTAREVEEVLGEQLSRTQLTGANTERPVVATKRRTSHTGTQRSRAASIFRRLRPVSVLIILVLAVGTGFTIWLGTRDKNLRTDQTAFVLLRQQGSLSFGSLSAAVSNAQSGDTIELRFSTPVKLPTLELNKALVLRAGKGFRPSLGSISDIRPLITTRATLVLEGLEFVTAPVDETESSGDSSGPSAGLRGPPGRGQNAPPLSQPRGIIVSEGAPLFIANCRFAVGLRRKPCLSISSPARVELNNCERYSPHGGSVVLSSKPEDSSPFHVAVRNCVQLASRGFITIFMSPAEGAWELAGNTIVGDCAFDWMGLPTQQLIVTASSNIFAVRAVMNRRTQGPRLPTDPTSSLFSWRETGNVFSTDTFSILRFKPGEANWDTESIDPTMPNLESWQKYWSLENTGSRELKLQLRGRLFGKPAEQRTLTPEDFRVDDNVPASGETVNSGANLELVGPGSAYERWRSSAAYQQWLSQLDGVLK